MAILVTGGTGFLGRHVTALLRASGEEVRVLARTVPAARAGAPADDGVRFVAGSVLDEEALAEASKGCRLVLHLAGRVLWGEHAPELFPLHVEGTRNVLRAAGRAGAARVVHVSTSGAVGISKDLSFVANEESPFVTELARRWAYYLSKIYAEKVALDEHQRGTVPVVVVSPALLLGPLGAPEGKKAAEGDAANGIVGKFLRREIAAIPPGVISVVDVRDAAQAVVNAGEKGRPGARYLLGVNLGMDELMDRLERASGVAAPRVKIPAGARHVLDRAASALETVERLAGYTGEEAASLAMAGYSWAVDDAAARRDLGFAPRPLDETIRAAVTAVERSGGADRAAPEGLVSLALDGLHRLTSPRSRPDPEPRPGAAARPDRSS